MQYACSPLAGFTYAPQLADLPDQKLWRVDHAAYGAFQDAARGRIDLVRVERYWEDILRIGAPSTQVQCGPTT